MPWELAAAIEHAHQICDWQDNLPREEVPPRWMWHVDHELDVWFQRVLREREQRFGGRGDVQDAPMTENHDPLVSRIRAMRR